jgi:ribosomal subunit interface protein
MKLSIKAANTTLTPAITDYVTKRVQGLDKFIQQAVADGSAFATVEVGKTSHHHNSGDIFRAEINLSVGGKMLRATADDSDLYVAVDKAKKDLAEELRATRTREQSVFRRGAQAIKRMLRRSPSDQANSTDL